MDESMPRDEMMEREDAEAAVSRSLSPLLRLYRPAFAAADRLLRSYAARFEAQEPLSQVSEAQRILLSRFADDLRSCWLLFERGYYSQGIGVAASALEVGFTAGHICFSQPKAAHWLDWNDPYRTPWPVSTLIESTATDEFLTGFRVWYTMFCWGKHANPMIQKQMPTSLTPAAHVVNVDPDITPAGAFRIYWGLYATLQLVILATKPLFEGDEGNIDEPWSALRILATELTERAKDSDAAEPHGAT